MADSTDADDPQRSAVSRHGIAAGMPRDGDVWYDMEAFLLDQVDEVLSKLSDGSIDDEIWGKIVVMEKGKRVAKAYLRHATVIVDGSEEEFDGKTLGFNAFSNPHRDEQTSEIRQKIKEGVILKMDLHGNIKGMARDKVPVIAQGWRDTKSNCLSEKLIRMQGKLNAEEKPFKIFDMRRWKAAVERLAEGEGEIRSLLPRACVRIALARDGTDMARTPAWIVIVNLVALDVLISRVPAVLKGSSASIPRPMAASSSASDVPAPPVPPPIPKHATQIHATGTLEAYGGHAPFAPMTATHPSQHTQLPHIVAAAVAAQMNQNLNQSSLLNPDQLAQIASALALTNQAKDSLRKSPKRMVAMKERRRPYKKGPEATDSSGEDSALRSESSSSGAEKSEDDKKKWNNRWESSTKSVDILYGGVGEGGGRDKEAAQKASRPRRPRLQDVVFTMSSSGRSTTSDYDSNRDGSFDSSSCSSTVSHCAKMKRNAAGVRKEAAVPSRSPSPPRPPNHAVSPSRPASQCYDVFQNNTTSIYERSQLLGENATSRPTSSRALADARRLGSGMQSPGEMPSAPSPAPSTATITRAPSPATLTPRSASRIGSNPLMKSTSSLLLGLRKAGKALHEKINHSVPSSPVTMRKRTPSDTTAARMRPEPARARPEPRGPPTPRPPSVISSRPPPSPIHRPPPPPGAGGGQMAPVGFRGLPRVAMPPRPPSVCSAFRMAPPHVRPPPSHSPPPAAARYFGDARSMARSPQSRRPARPISVVSGGPHLMSSGPLRKSPSDAAFHRDAALLPPSIHRPPPLPPHALTATRRTKA